MNSGTSRSLNSTIIQNVTCNCFFCNIARLLSEEEEKLKELMKLKEEQEEYIIRAQHEKLVLKQEMENKSKFLEEAQKQLEEVRVNRERVDQDVMVSVEILCFPFSPGKEFLILIIDLSKIFVFFSYPLHFYLFSSK